MLERIILAAALALGIACSSSQEEDLTHSDSFIKYHPSAFDVSSYDIGNPQTNNPTKDNPAATCPNGSIPKTYLRDRDEDGYFDKGVIACAPPNDGFKYIAKEDFIVAGKIPRLDCNDNPQKLGAITYPGAPELCNNNDDNCNDLTDENIPPETKPCETVCGKGYQYRDCLAGGEWSPNWSSCSAGIPAGEICNGADDDCDNIIDNNLLDAPKSCETYCGQGIPICKEGIWQCDPIATPNCCETVGEKNDLEQCNNLAQVFTVDFSMSMQGLTSAVQNSLAAYADDLEKKVSTTTIGIVAFTNKVLPPSGWPESYSKFKEWIWSYKNESSPEGHLDALTAAIELPWPEKAEKYIFLIGNSGFTWQSSKYTMDEIKAMAKNNSIIIIAIQTLENSDKLSSPDYLALAGAENTYYAGKQEEIPDLLAKILPKSQKYQGDICNQNHQWEKFSDCSFP